eukprot:CAMPEP_0119510332 /NCGR_PEP_ID=MMETSP1344-20130328/29350_1 /TAXON_ID=236787 /ORGANISM="Florenciella parvula, Strain CCMP2471" /LENGTH=67 /DNA_ID=CAMNT_0007547257 /DNA_START=56 /DNA_END=256 /DNA_ORIENTATION=-
MNDVRLFRCATRVRFSSACLFSSAASFIAARAAVDASTIISLLIATNGPMSSESLFVVGGWSPSGRS